MPAVNEEVGRSYPGLAVGYLLMKGLGKGAVRTHLLEPGEAVAAVMPGARQEACAVADAGPRGGAILP